MADIVNLRSARKRRARADKERQAEENRLRFGLSKDAKALEKARREREQRRLDSHLREPDDGA